MRVSGRATQTPEGRARVRRELAVAAAGGRPGGPDVLAPKIHIAVRARPVDADYDPATVPPDYQGYYARDQRLASGPHLGEPTPQEVREQGTSFCVGTPADCIRFLERYEALGIEEVFLLCAIGPAQHQEVLQTLRLFGEQVIPHFQAKEQRTAVAQAST